MLDPVERIDFKLISGVSGATPAREAVALAPARPDGELPPAYARRSSVREFSPEAVPFESLGGLLASLTQLEAGGPPTYRYPSGGGLYPYRRTSTSSPAGCRTSTPACTTTTRVTTSRC